MNYDLNNKQYNIITSQKLIWIHQEGNNNQFWNAKELTKREEKLKKYWAIKHQQATPIMEVWIWVWAKSSNKNLNPNRSLDNIIEGSISFTKSIIFYPWASSTPNHNRILHIQSLTKSQRKIIIQRTNHEFLVHYEGSIRMFKGTCTREAKIVTSKTCFPKTTNGIL